MKFTEDEEQIIHACQFRPRYSGPDSRKFWKQINHPANDATFYMLGCVLQDVESRVLQAVNAGVRIRAGKAIAASKTRKRAKPKTKR